MDGTSAGFPGVRTPAARLDHFGSLVDIAGRSLRADGAAQWLGDDLLPVAGRPVETWITARMGHVLALGSMFSLPGAFDAAGQALSGLRGPLHDADEGGWFAAVGPGDALLGVKQAYAHAFVVLAASSGLVAGVPKAGDLLDEALTTLDRRFWEADRGLFADEASRDWSVTDDYRGVNANMHAVEALLAAFDATGEATWLERAGGIGDRVAGWAEANDWRIPEHFDVSWNPLLEHNADRPRDPFKPYGATPGHGLEWARLLLQVDVAAGTPGRRSAAAVALYARAVEDAWDEARGGGFVYTTDWQGRPVEDRRFHWVAAEAVAAADVLGRVTGDPRYVDDAAVWWDWIDRHLVDHEQGSWFHELDTANEPSPRTWIGKPDVYHAAQAVLLPELELAGSFAGAVRKTMAGRPTDRSPNEGEAAS